MAKVFISYSRRDIEFAKRLTAELKKSNLDFWIDWEGIPPTVDWWREIEKGIEEADIFIFLISPDSVKSKVCGKEIDHAIKNGKRLIPLVVRDVLAEETPAQLSHLNYIFFRESDDFAAGVNKLLTSIHTDYEWVQTHRELQVKALEWKRNNREKSLLLNGKELQAAEYQLARNSSKEPHPTDLQREYVFASRKATDKQRRITGGIAIAAVIALAALAVWGWGQAVAAKLAQTDAENKQLLADSNAATAQAASTLALFNAMKADNQASTAQSASTLASGNAATAVANADVAATQKANAIQNADLARTAQAQADQNADLAGTARVEAENALVRVQAVAGYRAQALVSSSRRIENSNKDLATLLAIEAFQLASNPQTTNRMIEVLQQTLVIQQFNTQAGASSIDFNPQGTQLAAGYNDTAEVKLWDYVLGTSQTAAITDPNDTGFVLALSPNNNLLASGNTDGTINLWTISDPAAAAVDTALPGNGRITSLTFSTDGTRLASASDDLTVSIWDVNTEAPLGEFATSQTGPISSIALSPDGNTLAAGSDDRTIVLWDIKDPAAASQIATLPGHLANVTSLAFSPDGKLLASGSSGGQVLLWDLRDEDTRQQAIRIPTQDPTASYRVAFNPDGNLLTANPASGDVSVWSLQSDFWIQRACIILGGKKLNPTDWNRYFPGEQYRDTCSLPS